MAEHEGEDDVIGRARWLGHSAFLACVAVLLVNDHVLKARFPGWWTGKLSDFAGVAVVAVILAVLSGPNIALPTTAVLFVVLKVVPGGAELAAPVLGGVTRRDPTDLLALAVLLPLWFLLAHPVRQNDPPRSELGPPQRTAQHAGRSRFRAALATMVPVFGALTAVVATTATSCSPDPAVLFVTHDGQDLYAVVRPGSSSDQWARSNDSGATWQRSGPPAKTPTPTTRQGIDRDPGPLGPQQVCAAGRNCWRIRDRQVIEQVAPDGTATVELRLSDVEFSNTSTGCSPGRTGVLASITALETDRGVAVVASLGADGVLVRQGDGHWEQKGVLDAPPARTKGSWLIAMAELVATALVLGIVVWQFEPRRTPAWKRGLMVMGTGAFMTVQAMFAINLLSSARADVSGIISRTASIATLLTVIATVVTACWTREIRR